MWAGRLREMFYRPAISPYSKTFAWELSKRMPILTLQIYCSMYLIHDYIIQVQPSEGASMLPTVAMSDDFLYNIQMPLHKVLTRPFNGYFGNLAHYKNDQSMGTGLAVGDVVAAKSPTNPAITVSKRIIGLPGDTILVDPRPAVSSNHEQEWELPVKGRRDSRKKRFTTTHDIKSIRDEPVYVVVPKGHVWLAGDNLSNSTDSRDYGPVPLAMIEGKVFGKAIYMSLPTWQRLRNGLQKV